MLVCIQTKLYTMNKKVLLVTTDIMPFKALVKIAEFLKLWGIKISIAAEGKSVKLWKQAGYKLAFEGEENPKLLQTLHLSESEGIQKLFEGKENPDAVIVGLSNPINLEMVIAALANEKRIPLAIVSDTWGAGSRLWNLSPDFAFVIDAFDAGICIEKFPDAHVRIIGDISEKGIVAKRATIRAIQQMRGDTKEVLLLVGQGLDYIGSMVELVRDCITLEPKRWKVIPRLIHPKFKNDPRVPDLLKLLETFPKGVVQYLDEKEHATDDIAVCADKTVSCFSTTLRVVARYNRTRMAVSVLTPESQEGMKKSTGLGEYPLVSIGKCIQITSPTKLSQLQPKEPYVPCNFDPSVVLEMFE